MQLEIRLDGQAIVKADIDMGVAIGLLRAAERTIPGAPARSTPISAAQAEELLRRIDTKSARFLKQIAAGGGAVRWREMTDIFGITGWSDYSSHYGKGITRALRHITGDNAAQLVWWNDDEWPSDSRKWADCEVFIDGPALKSLREASGVEQAES